MADGRELGWNEAIIKDFHDHAGQITLGRLAGSRMLLMTTIGARTSEKHTVPLGYDPDGADYIVVGSNSGLDKHPAWLANIAANPIVTVEVGTESFQARAVPTDGRGTTAPAGRSHRPRADLRRVRGQGGAARAGRGAHHEDRRLAGRVEGRA